MKRKVVVTMSLAYWTDDDNYETAPTDEELKKEAEDMVDSGEIVSLIENGEELVTIKVEITETKE